MFWKYRDFLKDQKKRFENITQIKQNVLEQNIENPTQRILSVIDNMNKGHLLEENEENLNEDIKFIDKKLEFGK